MFMFDPMYFILILPALILATWAQSKVRGAFEKNSRIRARSGLSGAEVARSILDRSGLDNVSVEPLDSAGLGDHYVPRSQEIRLSRDVYSGDSLAALGIAAHEAGHALQHSSGYLWLGIRNTIIPVTMFGSKLAFPLFFIGLLMRGEFLMTLGIVFFATAVVFQLITLPVEYNASSRAVRILEGERFITSSEVPAVQEVLDAAALTYLAAALMAVMQLLYLLLLRGRRR